MERISVHARIARHIHSWLQEAMGDLADAVYGAGDPKWDKRIKQAKKSGVRDLKGWLADELYNDVDVLYDLLGDKVSDECGSDEQRVQVLVALQGDPPHKSALSRACQLLLNDLAAAAIKEDRG